MMKVMINRTDAIGDTILTLPMAQKIKEKYQDAKVYFLVSPVSKDLFKGNPYVDGFEVLEKSKKKSEKKKFVSDLLEKWGINYYLYVGGDEAPTTVAYEKKIPFRGGIKSRLRSFFYLKQGIRQKRSRVSDHEVFYNLELLKPMGIDIDKDNQRIAPPLSMEIAEVNLYVQKVRDELKEKGAELKDSYIVVHPGMTGHTQNWPPLYYINLVERIAKEYPGKHTFLISYTNKDRPYILPIKNRENHEIIFWENKGDLRTYMGLIKGAKLFIGPSTGPTHIANALGVPVAAIYSPVKIQSEKRWGPYFQEGQLQIFSPDVDCPQKKKCLGERCPYFDCMGKISPDDVGETIIKGKLL